MMVSVVPWRTDECVKKVFYLYLEFVYLDYATEELDLIFGLCALK